ncbi:hypothetical protein GM182_07030 [bacterium 3DAC]|nr:hypothetical protein GM182_07030 [bacterium 3DAC]
MNLGRWLPSFTLIIAILTITILFIQPTFAWDDCPFGETNDTYPGKCPHYIDTNHNGICDHSEPAPANNIGTQDTNVSQSKSASSSSVNFFIATIIGIFIVATAEILRKKNNRIVCWCLNVILAIGFLLSGISGLMLLISPSRIYGNAHIASSTIIFVVGIYHIYRHLSYYRNIPKVP